MFRRIYVYAYNVISSTTNHKIILTVLMIASKQILNGTNINAQLIVTFPHAIFCSLFITSILGDSLYHVYCLYPWHAFIHYFSIPCKKWTAWLIFICIHIVIFSIKYLIRVWSRGNRVQPNCSMPFSYVLKMKDLLKFCDF